MTTTQTTAGQALTATLRRYFSVGTRTRRFRVNEYGNRTDLHEDMIEALIATTQYGGYYTEATTTAFRPGYGTALSYEKHIAGFRADCTLIRQINEMTPWQFSALLGQMVDAGVTNVGQGERFFADMARTMRQAA